MILSRTRAKCAVNGGRIRGTGDTQNGIVVLGRCAPPTIDISAERYTSSNALAGVITIHAPEHIEEAARVTQPPDVSVRETTSGPAHL
jgi:hypothetical protein